MISHFSLFFLYDAQKKFFLVKLSMKKGRIPATFFLLHGIFFLIYGLEFSFS